MFRNKRYVIFIALLVCLVIAGIATYVYTQRIKPLVEGELKAFIQKSTQNLYQVTFQDISFNLWTGSAQLTNIRFYPDTSVYNQQILNETAPNNLYYIQLEKLSIDRFRPWSMYFKKEAKIKRLTFEQPQIHMVNKQFAFNENLPPKPRKSPYAYISKFFKSLQIQEIVFKQARVQYTDRNSETEQVDSLNNLNVTLTDWLIDAHSAKDTSRIYLVKDVKINLDNYQYATPDSLYFIKVNQLDFHLKAGKVHIKKFNLEPRYSAFEFGTRSGFAKDHFLINLNDLLIHGIDLHAYISKQHFIAQRVEILDGRVHVQNDNRFPKKIQDRTGRFPHQLLQQLSTKIKVDSIQLQNIDVSYAEFDRDSQQAGKVSFENTKGLLKHVGNLDPNQVMEAQIETYVMGQGKMWVNFQFNRFDPKGGFNYQGKLTNLDGKTLNQITKPLGMLQINRAQINELAFDITANSDRALGTLDFRYKDLSVALLKKEVGKERLVRQGWLSFLANNLVINGDNPNVEGQYTQAKINYKRETTASFFNFIWKSLFQGVKHSVGLTLAKELEIQRQIARFEKLKENREERKENREERKIKREIRKSKRQ
ncbi:MAG: hypothetical protein EOO99_01455 [Pedobacter sp.]|nr:MAG: hypothetical protein EOO99_01455 [Pedobacter sp.]